MTAAPPAVRQAPSPATAAAGLGGVVLAVAMGLVAHGCHGADVDHEPGVAGPADPDHFHAGHRPPPRD